MAVEVPGDPLHRVAPAYGRASLAELLPAVVAALTDSDYPGDGAALTAPGPRTISDQLVSYLRGVRRVAVLQVDGLGYYQLAPAAAVAPTLAEFTAGRLGRVWPITTGFPSTTPTGLTTLGAGAPPGQHGILGFRLRIPGTDDVLTHVRWRDDPAPAVWQPLPTQFQRAAAAGVAVRVVARGEYAGSGLTGSAWRGGRYTPASSLRQLARKLLLALRRDPAPVLVYGYCPELDAAGHLSGIDTPQWRQAAGMVDRLLARLVARLPGDAALLVTADHGQLNIPTDTRIDLAAEPRLRHGVGAVAGEARVRYLHPRPGATEEVIAAWRERLGDAAWVGHRQELVDAGWFGPVSPAHLPRIGEVVVVCGGQQVVLASHLEPARDAELVAYHGSWTAAEMLVPLLLVRGG